MKIACPDTSFSVSFGLISWISNRIYLSFYKGNDKVLISTRDEANDMSNYLKTNNSWGNTTGSLRFNTVLSDKLFMNTIFGYVIGYVNYHYLEDLKSKVKQGNNMFIC